MDMFENNKSNNKSNNESIKDNIITILKESMKFALIGIVLFLIIGTLLFYIFLDILKIEMEIAAMLIGIITAVLIVIIDDKKIHTVNKVAECNRRIFIRINEKIMKK